MCEDFSFVDNPENNKMNVNHFAYYFGFYFYFGKK